VEGKVTDLYIQLIEYQVQSVCTLFASLKGKVWSHIRNILGRENWRQRLDNIKALETSLRDDLKDHLDAEAKDSLNAINEKSNEQLDMLRKLVNLSEAEQEKIRLELDALLGRFHKPQHQDNFEKVASRREDTGHWLFENPDYQTWKHSSSGFLWIEANPGRGKSVLAKSIVCELRGDDEITVCHGFFSGKNGTPSTALCSLLYQLFENDYDLLSQVRSAIEKKGSQLTGTFRDLWEIFDRTLDLRDPRQTTIVLDAMDECDKDHTPEATAEELFAKLLCRINKGDVRFLVTSRPIPKLQRLFQLHTSDLTRRSSSEQPLPYRVNLEDNATGLESLSRDIDGVIEAKIAELVRMRGDEIPSEQRQLLEDELKSYGSQRTYLWVKLIFQHLMTVSTPYDPSEWSQKVREFPVDIDKTYRSLLDTVPEGSQAIIRSVLETVAAAKKSLYLSELDIAVAVKYHIETHAPSIPSGKPRLRGADGFKSWLLQNCGYFLEVYKDRVYFIHQTAKDFLLLEQSSQNRSSLPGWLDKLDDQACHRTLAICCLGYLSSYPERHQREELRAFDHYAASYWAVHYGLARVRETEDLMMKLLYSFISGTRPNESFSRWTDTVRSWKDFSEDYEDTPSQGHEIEDRLFDCPSNPSSAYFAACAFALDDIALEIVTTQSLIVSERNMNGRTGLHVACQHGNARTVSVLLNELARKNKRPDGRMKGESNARRSIMTVVLNSQDNDLRTPLISAAHQGHLQVISFLLDTGCVHLNSHDNPGETALHAAYKGNHIASIRLLLDHGVDINAIDEKDWMVSAGRRLYNGEGGTVLHRAAAQGDIEALRLFLGAGADINARDAEDGTALQWAVTIGSIAAVNLLLQHGADVTLQDFAGLTALHCALIPHINPRILSLLLKQENVDVNAQDRRGLTVLHWLVRQRQPAALQEILLKKPVSVNIQDIEGKTPLHEAILVGDHEMVSLLLNPDALVDIQDDRGMTPLHIASGLGHIKIVQQLLDHGARIDTMCKAGTTALHRACLRGDHLVIKTLLQRGADVNLHDNKGETALVKAAGTGNYRILELVSASSSAKLEVKALEAAAKNGHEKMVQQLLQDGCPAGDRGTHCWSMTARLYQALQENDEILTIELAQRGASIHLRDESELTLLHQAVIHQKHQLTSFLLSEGLDVDAKDVGGNTPLHLAATSSNPELVSLLLQYGAKPGMRNNLNKTPLRTAIESHDMSVVAELHAVGAGFREDDEEQESLLLEASRLSRHMRQLYSGDLECLNPVIYGDLDEAIQSLLEILRNPNAQLRFRAKAGWIAARLLIAQQSWEQSVDIFRESVNILHALYISLPGCTDHLNREFAGVSNVAAAAALQAGRPASYALELLELGRGISHRYQACNDMRPLKQKYPASEQKLKTLQDQMSSRKTGWSAVDREQNEGQQPPLLEEEDFQELYQQFGDTVSTIRLLPEFENFLAPFTAVEFMAQSDSGPMVAINVSRYRCDAFVIMPEAIQLVPLPFLHHQDIADNVTLLQSMSKNQSTSSVKHSATGKRYDFERGIPEVRRWLGEVAVDPILEVVKKQYSTETNVPRLWWIPSGLLGLLPLHAASLKGYKKYVSDYVVSSYCPSVTALVCARKNGSPKLTMRRAVLAAMPTTPGCGALVSAEQELDGISATLPDTLAVVKLKQPRHADIVKHIQSCSIFHFAGHCKSDKENPANGCLITQDWQTQPLTIQDILGLELQAKEPAWLAYLSACSTAVNHETNIYEESVDLASAFQLSGFRHVVCSLWHVSDRYSAAAAKVVYQTMLNLDPQADEAVARGVHAAVMQLKKLGRITMPYDMVRDIAPKRSYIDVNQLFWASYIHIGP
jgi:ankyrin repeat protein/CHAT domain-containing protein